MKNGVRRPGDPANPPGRSPQGLAWPSSAVLRRAVALFIPLAVLATISCGLIYVEAQQSTRSGANDPQYQLAEDAAARLDAGAAPASVVDRSSTVDLASSLAPFITVFDSYHVVVATDATLDAGIPAPPHSVLDAASAGSPSAVTWQPRAGVRIAAVTVAWKGGFVLAGRSLQRVEQQEANAELIAGAGLASALAALALACLAAAWLWQPRETPSRAD
jgi:hypothetical protein